MTREQYIAETIASRIEELVKTKEVQDEMMKLNDNDAKAFVTRLAIATLFGRP